MRTICILALGMITLSSCFKNYFSVNSKPQWSQNAWQDLDRKEKTIYIHFGDQVRQMKDPVVTDSTIQGSLQLPGSMPYIYLYPENPKMNKYKYRDREMLFAQIHVYVKDSTLQAGEFTVDKTNFERMEIYHPNKGASVGSHVLGGVLVFATVAGIVFSVAAISFFSYY
jgi:hypothetical protein